MKTINYPSLSFGSFFRTRHQIQQCSVFIVDDSEYDLQLMKRYLNLFPNKALDNSVQLIIEGYGNSKDCLRELYRKPDIVVLDYYLDTFDDRIANGLELMKQIHDRSPDTQIVFVSGQTDKSITAELIKYGAFGYVAKDQYYEKQLQEIITEMVLTRQLGADWSRIKFKRNLYTFYGIVLYSLIAYCLIRICS